MMMADPLEPIYDPLETEKARAAAGCSTLASVARELGCVAIQTSRRGGCLDRYGQAFLDWANLLEENASQLRGPEQATRRGPGTPSYLRLVK